ncbi:MAG: M28 family peptidase [Deltaproteobacteria bacterium]|nr:MAG: M28 family peptidase [Deltaproteobacteria bacterium]
MRTRPGASRTVVALVAGCIGLACQAFDSSRPPPPPVRAPLEPAPVTDFSGERAWAHLEALTALGPRVAGTPGADAAREYIRAQLESFGLTVREHAFELPGGAPAAPAPSDPDEAGEGGASEAESPEPDSARAPAVEIVHLSAVIPGASPDLFLLAAHFDTARFDAFRFVGTNESASGPAVLLELARQLARSPLPYTTWITFLDGEARFAPGAEPLAGSRALAEQLARDDTLERIRFAVFLGAVGDAELTIARDARSHRRYRERFFEIGQRIGYPEAFARSSPLTTLDGSHVAFLARQARRVVMIADDRFGGGEPPGVYWHTEDDTPDRCSADSLEAVGHVTLLALREFGSLLQKVDRFVPRPAPESETVPAPEAEDPVETEVEAESPADRRPPGTLEPEPAGDVPAPDDPAAAGAEDRAPP